MPHTGKGLYGNNGAKSTADLILLEQKGPESVENQGPEGSQPVGKDEAGSSDLPGSARKPLKSSDLSGFLFCFFRHRVRCVDRFDSQRRAKMPLNRPIFEIKAAS